jgi:GAF domain-containing protein/HAMP domain-containing protein
MLFDPSVEAGEGSSVGFAADLRQHLLSSDSYFIIAENQHSTPALLGHTILRQEHLRSKLTPSESEILDTVSNLGWVVVVQQEIAEALASVDQIVQVGLVVGVVAIVLASLVALFVARTITRPLTTLGAAAEQIGAGNLDASLPPATNDEIGRLTVSFEGMAAQLRDLIGSLEERVADRTRRLEIVAILGERLSAILDFDQLLTEMVNQVKERFDYYHAHVYIIDDNRHNLVMTAGAGEAGVEMKAKGHQISLDAPTSLVARTARTGEIVSVDNVREAEDWLPNPLLPDTYSEMAIPITLEGQVVGVLDVQEDEIAGLDEGDANLLRSLANQVAVAIRNARLFEGVETALAEAREAQRRYVEQVWEKAKSTRQAGKYRYIGSDGTSLAEEAIVEAKRQALSQDQPAIVAVKGGAKPGTILAPVTLGDQTIGALQLHRAGEREDVHPWTDEDLALIETVLDQVAQTAETLRLFEDTRERAGREATIREITDKLRAAPNLDVLLETAGRELGQQLGVPQTVLELGIETEQALNNQ